MLLVKTDSNAFLKLSYLLELASFVLTWLSFYIYNEIMLYDLVLVFYQFT